MTEKMLRKIMLTNMALWGFAILLPIIAPAFASKEPKIFDILIPMLQLMLAGGSTRMFVVLRDEMTKSLRTDVETK